MSTSNTASARTDQTDKYVWNPTSWKSVGTDIRGIRIRGEFPSFVMMENYLDSQPTITEHIMMAGECSHAQVGRRKLTTKAKNEKRTKAQKAVEEFEKAWGQNIAK